MKKVKKRRLTSLFFRILGGISIPLLCLLAVFTGLMLHREISLQKRLYSQEMRGDVESLSAKFMELVATPDSLSPDRLKQEIERIGRALKFHQLEIFDPSTGRSLTDYQRKAADEDNSNIQISLTLRREGVPYYLLADDKKQRMLAYVPIREKTQNKIFAARAERSMDSLKRAWQETLATFWIMAAFILGAAFVIALLLTMRIVRPIREINRACRQILSGQLGLQVNVRTGDELELMASHFNRMSQALLSMTRQATDSNPLTGLPGNQGIASELSRRLESREKFVFFHVDIDHFKAYNDHYGLKRGDDVLRITGQIISKAVKDADSENNFLGHQGGDDFVLMLEPARAKSIAERICQNFDAELKNFYDKEDFERGYFLGEDSRSTSISDAVAEVKRQPLMSITLAGVTNIKNEFFNYEDVLERAVPVKKKGKKIPYSKYLIEE